MELLELKEFYKNKRVLITGHTGFKGAWLTIMLKSMGANICGYSLAPENIRGNLFEQAQLSNLIQNYYADINDIVSLQKIFDTFQPEIVIHLAAQAIVLLSYADPVQTFLSNSQGTVNILECVRQTPSCKAILCITTDKCYDNKEWCYPYRETDPLGGKDPYSASKAMAEIAINAYRTSFFKEKNIACASARAGNVIGGGDYAKYRIMPDTAESIAYNRKIILRNPNAIRPWQHVLDALYGYLILTKKMYCEPETYSKAYNFAPLKDNNIYNIKNITEIYLQSLNLPINKYEIEFKHAKPEAKLLQLDPSLAFSELSWSAKLDVKNAIEWTAKWYYDVNINKNNAYEYTSMQIKDYFNISKNNT